MVSVDEMSERYQKTFETFQSTMSTIHSQIARLNERLDAQDRERPHAAAPAQPAPAVVSHRGIGSLPPAAKPVSPGDPETYEQDRQQWAAQTMKSMREDRNCGLASNVYADFVEEIERTESTQSSIIIQQPMPIHSSGEPMLPRIASPNDGLFTKQTQQIGLALSPSPTAQPTADLLRVHLCG